MKHIISLLIATMLAFGNILVADNVQNDGNKNLKDGPSIEFKTQTHDMGTIKAKNGKVNIEFEFVNAGNAPLVITGASASCGCTQPAYPEAPIAPGKTGVISVTYNPVNKSGEVSSTVTVRTNDKKHKKLNLKIKGLVVPK